MVKPYQVIENKSFIGRKFEFERLSDFESSPDPAILVVYGRRRVGKTELIEQFFAERNLIKLEGLENEPEATQIQNCLYQLSRYLSDPYIAKLNLSTWVEVLDLIADKISSGVYTLYFEELQWLANYEHHFISALKYVWDNRFRHHKNLKIILCGSSPSFMVKNVIYSKALYNRSTHEMRLNEFSIKETQQYLTPRSEREVMTAYLTLGGIPEYLKQIKNAASVLIGICENSFMANSYFSHEHERIFISSMADNHHYREVIDFLSQRRFASRTEIAEHLKISPGGSLSDVLNDLELCGFLEKLNPIQAQKDSRLSRYCVRDPYLMFYFKFIKNIYPNIESGIYNANPIQALSMESFLKWMGFAFERFIRRNHNLIAKILGFSGIRYQSGPFYNRKSQQTDEGYQIDLLFDRDDHVRTICEVKYYSDKVDTNVIAEMERKIKLLPNPKNYSIQKVLITTEGITEGLLERHYFDRVITLVDLFHDRYWI